MIYWHCQINGCISVSYFMCACVAFECLRIWWAGSATRQRHDLLKIIAYAYTISERRALHVMNVLCAKADRCDWIVRYYLNNEAKRLQNTSGMRVGCLLELDMRWWNQWLGFGLVWNNKKQNKKRIEIGNHKFMRHHTVARCNFKRW